MFLFHTIISDLFYEIYLTNLTVFSTIHHSLNYNKNQEFALITFKPYNKFSIPNYLGNILVTIQCKIYITLNSLYMYI